MTPDSDCEAVRAVASLWLDRRMGTPARAQVETHLRACEACRAEYRDLVRLGRAVARLPRRAPSPMAARRALAAARSATPMLHARRLPSARVAAAALLLFGAGLTAAYLIGLRRGRATAAPPTDAAVVPMPAIAPIASMPAPVPSPVAPSPVASPPPELMPAPPAKPPRDGASSPIYARAATSLLTDVATIDEVAPKLRQPLLGAQIRVFRLDAWAARPPRPDDPDAELIAQVRQIEAALASRQDASLFALQRSFRADAPRRAAASHRPPRLEVPSLEVPAFTRAEADAVVRTYDDLAAVDRASLADLLEAKASWVAGDARSALERVHATAPKGAGGRLATPYRTLVILSAGEVGDRKLLEALQKEIDGALDEVLGDLLRQLREGGKPPTGH